MTILNHLFLPLLFLFISCTENENTTAISFNSTVTKPPEKIREIPLPKGFGYIKTGDSLYANWLLDLKLKNSTTVYLYNGSLKENQFAQFAVLDMDIGKKDLIQCADAAMKLKADFLFSERRFSEIRFIATPGDELSFEKYMQGTRWKEQKGRLVSFITSSNQPDKKTAYNAFMEFVFSYCGTYSLSKQLKEVNNPSLIQPGDVFIEGGFPGHAVTVMAVATNNMGKRLFLLSQSYMPAQDIHILKNDLDPELNPWFDAESIFPLYTPQWKFASGSLKRW